MPNLNSQYPWTVAAIRRKNNQFSPAHAQSGDGMMHENVRLWQDLDILGIILFHMRGDFLNQDDDKLCRKFAGKWQLVEAMLQNGNATEEKV